MLRADQDVLRRHCWDRAIHAYGTAAIFERRAANLRRQTQILTFLGIVGPLAVGSMVLSFGVKAWWVPGLLVIASILGAIQLVMSVWSVVANWSSSWAYAQESASDNHRLSDAYQRLGSNPPDDLALRVELLDASYGARSGADVGQAVLPQEKRYGHRVGLHRFQRPCVECKLIPVPATPTGCSVCGK